jgi:hypothetical protein
MLPSSGFLTTIKNALGIEACYQIMLCSAQPRAELAARLARACCGAVATAQPAQGVINILLGLAATVSQLQCAHICSVPCCTSWQYRLHRADCRLCCGITGLL